MHNYKLSIHHIGGRAGSRSFPDIEKFEKDLINVLYEADADCTEQILKINQDRESVLHVLPYALGNKCKSGVLNINYDPYTSSLLQSNNSYDSFYMFNHDHDYILGETTKTIEKRDVELVTIDEIFKSNQLDFPKPDFLSIDVEGGEYGVLEGASKTMNSNILAIYAEVTFHPFRVGQKSFSELCDLLSDYGFYFATFSNSDNKIYMEEMSPYRYPIGLRGSGFHTLSEALFLRKIDFVESKFPEKSKYISLRKLAFISMVFNQIEFGLECLNRSKLLDHKNIPNEFLATNYAKFLEELLSIVDKHSPIFPQTFKSKFSFEKSKDRFNYYGLTPGGELKTLLKKISIIKKLSPKIRIIINKIGVKARASISGFSKFEKTFIKYGLII